ncbi:LCP family protein [Paenactinomyces guangxiensis]|uniref:LCP family protein n=1 Tax=Paenactinomyces guangxiensis TaxID=1490290 RepID=A0A7W1WSW9_9BACL|nr:LCP family protein [Paenactinomyces guangxiensis]MBA4495374.1 LCP family protein [Paenactinomyces guangxiensis]MBH8592505.1 LCP family protein [Paenactinomyces guangxiensis]
MGKGNESRVVRIQKKRRKKWAFRVMGLILILIIGIGSYLGYQAISALTKSHDSEVSRSKRRQKPVEPKKEPFAVLLLGSDQIDTKAEQKIWRPDVIMVAAVNPKTKSVKLLSIPRDTKVTIANTDGFRDKINHSAYWGKMKGKNPIDNTRETVENLLDIPIDYYAKVNFRGFVDIVDAVGGVDVNNRYTFRGPAINQMKTIPAGQHHLNGMEALAYVRQRKAEQNIEGDMGRNERQQEVISQIVDKMISAEGIANFPKISRAVGDNLSFNIDIGEIPSIAAVYQNIPISNIETVKVETYPDKIKGISYLILSEKEKQRIRDLFKQYMELKSEEDNPQSDQTSNGFPGHR